MSEKLYRQIQSEIPESCRLLIVSKYRTNEQIMDYYRLGHRIFAENRVQEFCKKQQSLPSDIEWHFIGHLQKNKAKYIVPFIKMIHSVDSIELVDVLEKEAVKCNRILPILIQFNLAQEETKSGINKDEAIPFIKECLKYPHILVKGIMCMGPHCSDDHEIQKIFHETSLLLENLQIQFPDMTELSMGMSQDYHLAIKEKSTMIRIGTALFTE